MRQRGLTDVNILRKIYGKQFLIWNVGAAGVNCESPSKAHAYFVGKLGPIWFGSLGKSGSTLDGKKDALRWEVEEEWNGQVFFYFLAKYVIITKILKKKVINKFYTFIAIVFVFWKCFSPALLSFCPLCIFESVVMV